MKRKEIKAGVVYAVTSAYGHPSPIVFLEDGAAGLYTHDRYHADRKRQVQESGHVKAKAARSFDPAIGYAALISFSHAAGERVTLDDQLAALRAADPAAELARFTANEKPSDGDLRFQIVTSLAKIAPWDDAVAAYEAGREADRRRMAEADAKRDRTNAVVAALRKAGIVSASRDSGHGLAEWVTISIADAEQVLARLRKTEAGR